MYQQYLARIQLIAYCRFKIITQNQIFRIVSTLRLRIHEERINSKAHQNLHGFTLRSHGAHEIRQITGKLLNTRNSRVNKQNTTNLRAIIGIKQLQSNVKMFKNLPGVVVATAVFLCIKHGFQSVKRCIPMCMNISVLRNKTSRDQVMITMSGP